MLCPTRFVVDSTENSKAARRPKCAAPRLVYDSALVLEAFMRVYVCTIVTTNYVHHKKKQESPLGGQVSGWTCSCVHHFRVYLLETAWTLCFGAENMCILRSRL